MFSSDKSLTRFEKFLLIALQSDQDGEAAAAIKAARAILKADSINPHDIVARLRNGSVPPPPPPPPEDLTEFYRQSIELLVASRMSVMRQKDLDFIQKCRSQIRPFSEKQMAWLHDIVERYRLYE
jgi:hypothetical protein